jgi:hypothetical protein
MIKMFNLKVVPVIGLGAFLDLYNIKSHGMDGWSYTVILPFVRIRAGIIYLPPLPKE